MIAFACSHCGLKLKVKPEFAGRSSKCPTCKHSLIVPQPEATEGHVPAGQIDGTASSVHQAGVDGGVTLGDSGKAGQKSVRELLAKGKAGGQRYVIESEIARGGMGAVLRAIDCDLRREVAVKYMLDQTDAKKKARFLEEAQITGQLEHPNIVPIHELGVDAKKRLFFSMRPDQRSGAVYNCAQIMDLTPLDGIKLETLSMPPLSKETRGLEVVRRMGSLKTIQVAKVYPAAEFWKRYDAGEFK